MSVQEKRMCIDAGHPQLSIARQCELIGLPRASYYREIPLVGERGELGADALDR
jgi:hypothetical protein